MKLTKFKKVVKQKICDWEVFQVNLADYGNVLFYCKDFVSRKTSDTAYDSYVFLDNNNNVIQTSSKNLQNLMLIIKDKKKKNCK